MLRITFGTYEVQLRAKSIIDCQLPRPNAGRQRFSYSAASGVFSEIETVSIAPLRRCAVGSLLIRSESPFVFSRIGMEGEVDFMCFATAMTVSSRSVGSP